jgi:hypothetical protein
MHNPLVCRAPTYKGVTEVVHPAPHTEGFTLTWWGVHQAVYPRGVHTGTRLGTAQDRTQGSQEAHDTGNTGERSMTQGTTHCSG